MNRHLERGEGELLYVGDPQWGFLDCGSRGVASTCGLYLWIALVANLLIITIIITNQTQSLVLWPRHLVWCTEHARPRYGSTSVYTTHANWPVKMWWARPARHGTARLGSRLHNYYKPSRPGPAYKCSCKRGISGLLKCVSIFCSYMRNSQDMMQKTIYASDHQGSEDSSYCCNGPEDLKWWE